MTRHEHNRAREAEIDANLAALAADCARYRAEAEHLQAMSRQWWRPNRRALRQQAGAKRADADGLQAALTANWGRP